jgi:hypothetical protein
MSLSSGTRRLLLCSRTSASLGGILIVVVPSALVHHMWSVCHVLNHRRLATISRYLPCGTTSESIHYAPLARDILSSIRRDPVSRSRCATEDVRQLSGGAYGHFPVEFFHQSKLADFACRHSCSRDSLLGTGTVCVNVAPTCLVDHRRRSDCFPGGESEASFYICGSREI